MASQMSIGDNKEWVEVKTESGVIAFWTRPLSSGSFPPCKFSLSLRIEYEHSVFTPICILRFRSDKASLLPRISTLRIAEGDLTTEELTCNSEPVFSLIGKDYVSIFRFLIKEEGLIKLFHGSAKCTVSYFDDLCPISFVSDDTLTYAKLKKHLNPESLSSELKNILLIENERIEEEKRRIREQKEKERLEEIERIRKEEEAKKDKAQKDSDYNIQKKFVQIRILNYLLCNSVYIELKDCFIVSDPLSYPSMFKDLNQYVLEGLAQFTEQCQFKLDDINTAAALRILPSRILSESRTDKDRKYCKFFGDSFYHYRIINENSTLSNKPSIDNVKSAVSTAFGYYKDLLSSMDFKPMSFESAAKGLAREFIEDSVLVKKVFKGTEYMVFTYSHKCYDKESIYYKARLNLERYGIVSDSQKECLDRESRYYENNGYVLYVNDYNAICKILDGPLPQTPQKDTSTNGCYIATCVYGSYDCPEVWTLRRYRDQELKETMFGRLFIQTYYATSPSLVRWFGETGWFKSVCRFFLDKFVMRLQNKGLKNTPYND